MNKQTTSITEHPLASKKRAVVIGASTGLGAALCKELTQKGYFVAAVSRNQEMLNTLCQEINQNYPSPRAAFFPHDAKDFDEAPSLFKSLLRDLGEIDLVIYNAGILNNVGSSEYDFEKDLESIQVNLLGAMAWLNQAAELFEHLGRGTIVGISSVAGDRGRVGNPAYNTSKAGLSTYLEALRNRLSRHGVHVLTVKPGFMQTQMLAGSKTTFGVISPEKAASQIYKAIRKGKQTVYVPRWWQWMMLVIRHIPSFIFRRLSF